MFDQEQPSIDVLIKSCSENMQRIYSRSPMPECNFNKVSKQLYWGYILAWVFSCKFAENFQKNYS